MNRLTRSAVLLIALIIAAQIFAIENPVPESPAFSIRSVASGRWSDIGTWEPRRLPQDGDRVLIARKTRVVFDSENSAVIRYLQISGTLTLSREQSTTLNAGIVTIQSTAAA